MDAFSAFSKGSADDMGASSCVTLGETWTDTSSASSERSGGGVGAPLCLERSVVISMVYIQQYQNGFLLTSEPHPGIRQGEGIRIVLQHPQNSLQTGQPHIRAGHIFDS